MAREPAVRPPGCVADCPAGPARVLDINAPAGFDEFVAAAGQPAAALTLPPPDQPAPDVERLASLAAEHQIELLGPPGSLP